MRIVPHDALQLIALLRGGAVGSADAVLLGAVGDVLVKARLDLPLLQEKIQIAAWDLDRAVREKEDASFFEISAHRERVACAEGIRTLDRDQRHANDSSRARSPVAANISRPPFRARSVD